MKLAIAIPSVGIPGLLFLEVAILRDPPFSIYISVLGICMALVPMAIAAVYGVILKRSYRLAFLAWFLSAYFLTILMGALLPLICTLWHRPDISGYLVAADRALGLNWTAYAHYMFFESGILGSILLRAYSSFGIEGLILVCFLSLMGSNRRMVEYILLFFLSVTFTGLLFGLFPASIAPTGYGATEFDAYFPLAATIQAVVSGRDLHLDSFIGLVSFPSFHVIGAIMITFVCWRTVLFVPALILNLLIVAAVPAFGGHYFVDVIAGAVVAAITIALSRVILPRVPQREAGGGTSDMSRPYLGQADR